MQDIFVEEDKGKSVKVMKNIYGLTNLGRTFLVSQQEVNSCADKAETQMMQKYGAEVYGKSAQYKNQKSTGGLSQTAVSEAGGSGPISSGGGLIHCTVTPLKELPDKFFEASGDSKQIGKALDELEKYLLNKANDKEWKAAHAKDAETLLKSKRNMRYGQAPSEDMNKTSIDAIGKLLGGEEWTKMAQSDDQLKKII